MSQPMPFSDPLFLAAHGNGVRRLLVLTEQEMAHFHAGFTTRIQEDCSVVVAVPDGDSVVCPVGATRALVGEVRLRLRVCDTRQHAEAALVEFDATPEDVCLDCSLELLPGDIVECDFEEVPAE